MDWASAFEVAHPRPGATDAAIKAFAAEVARPVSVAEVREVNNSQRNPFPASDPLHAGYRPFDAAAWLVPDRPLPESYLSFLRWSDGGEFGNGERWFQFFSALEAGDGVRATTLAHHLPQYMPGALPVALNGGGTFYLLDMRLPASGGEYPVVCAHAGFLSWVPGAWRVVADSFGAACRGRVNVEDLPHPEAIPGDAV